MTIRISKNPQFASPTARRRAKNPSTRMVIRARKKGTRIANGSFLDWLNQRVKLPKRPARVHRAGVTGRGVRHTRARARRRSVAGVRRAATDSGGGDPEPEPRSSYYSYAGGIAPRMGGAL